MIHGTVQRFTVPQLKRDLQEELEKCLARIAAAKREVIEVDKRGKVKDRTWKGIQKMMSDSGRFLQNLKSFKDVIDGGTVPAANVEEARKLKDGDRKSVV